MNRLVKAGLIERICKGAYISAKIPAAGAKVSFPVTVEIGIDSPDKLHIRVLIIVSTTAAWG